MLPNRKVSLKCTLAMNQGAHWGLAGQGSRGTHHKQDFGPLGQEQGGGTGSVDLSHPPTCGQHGPTFQGQLVNAEPTHHMALLRHPRQSTKFPRQGRQHPNGTRRQPGKTCWIGAKRLAVVGIPAHASILPSQGADELTPRVLYPAPQC